MCPSPALTARHFWLCAIYWTRIAAISGMLMMFSHPTLIVRIKLSLVAMTLISSPTVCHSEQDSAPLPQSAVLSPFWCIWFPKPTRIHPMTSKQNQYHSHSSLSIHRSSFLPRTLFWRTLCLLASIAGRMSVNASSMALPQVWTILFVWWVWNESHASYWLQGIHCTSERANLKSNPALLFPYWSSIRMFQRIQKKWSPKSVSSTPPSPPLFNLYLTLSMSKYVMYWKQSMKYFTILCMNGHSLSSTLVYRMWFPSVITSFKHWMSLTKLLNSVEIWLIVIFIFHQNWQVQVFDVL